ncbi:hypothetical protein SB861_47535, partial [Paraburkholderia sp. SIMBA_049]
SACSTPFPDTRFTPNSCPEKSEAVQGDGTRGVTIQQSGDAVTSEARSFFRGVAIGVRVALSRNATAVEFFERRGANPVYLQMVKHCMHRDDYLDGMPAIALPQRRIPIRGRHQVAD